MNKLFELEAFVRNAVDSCPNCKVSKYSRTFGDCYGCLHNPLEDIRGMKNNFFPTDTARAKVKEITDAFRKLRAIEHAISTSVELGDGADNFKINEKMMDAILCYYKGHVEELLPRRGPVISDSKIMLSHGSAIHFRHIDMALNLSSEDEEGDKK